MKVTLYNAISADGFIATADGDSNWVSSADETYFEREMKQAGCIVVGRKTFEQFKGDLYPVDGITNFVITGNSGKEETTGNLIITKQRPKDILDAAAKIGHDSVLLVGGGITNTSFLQDRLIDEVILSVHALLLGDGISLFEGANRRVNLSKLNVTELADGLVQIRYRVRY